MFTSFSIINGESVSESPHIKVIIDGNKMEYKDVPIIIGGRTLLPFREILNNLGVSNEEEYIKWNSKEKSVTINSRGQNIYLKIGEKIAYVNGMSLTLDVAPVIYKDRTYIPARFISQSLGMKVGWDATSTTVLIRSQDGYKYVEEILNKSIKAMDTQKSYSIQQDGETSITLKGVKALSKVQISTKKNIEKKLYFSKIKSQFETSQKNSQSSVDIFSDGIMTYVKNDGKWDIKDTDSYDFTRFKELVADDVLCSGLTIEAENTNEVILKGNINLKGFVDEYYKIEGIDSYKISNVSCRVVLDSRTFLLKSITMNLEGKIKEDTLFKATITATYNEYNIEGTIVPDDLIFG